MEHPAKTSKELMRLETFSDGVFAIATTLLILEVIQMLHVGNSIPLRQLLFENWKSLFVFLLGFLTILICWINHHLVLAYAERMDSAFFWVNGFVLLVVTFTPFPTAILAAYLEKESRLALAIFGFNYFMVALSAYCFTVYIYNKLVAKEKRQLLFYYKLLYKYGLIYTFLVFFICFLSVPIAIVLCVLLFALFAFPKEFALWLWNMKQKRKNRSSTRAPAQ